jgi:hypothetical protein
MRYFSILYLFLYISVVILLGTSHPLALVEGAVEECLRDAMVHLNNILVADEEWVNHLLLLDVVILLAVEAFPHQDGA